MFFFGTLIEELHDIISKKMRVVSLDCSTVIHERHPSINFHRTPPDALSVQLKYPFPINIRVEEAVKEECVHFDRQSPVPNLLIRANLRELATGERNMR